MGFREYIVEPECLEQASRIGLESGQCPACGSAGETLEHLVACLARHSARYSHPKGNRRCGPYVMMVEGEVVTSIDRIGGSAGLTREQVIAITRKHGFEVGDE